MSDLLKRLRSYNLSLSDCYDIISSVAMVPYDSVVANPLVIADLICNPEIIQSIEEQLKANVPVAYITGRKEFYGLEFKVNQHTLIPRPDTETLVECVITAVAGFTPARSGATRERSEPSEIKILDLCTGSGCILLALLANLPSATGVGVDISSEALLVAQENAERLGLADRAKFIEADALELDIYNDFDIVTMNPPYLSAKEYPDFPLLVSEPRSALVADDDGYIFYKKVLCQLDKLSNNIRPAIFFEVGYQQAAEVVRIASKYGFTLNIKDDMNAIPRVVYGNLEV
ncbi:MAG: peptide chain release factor N(5)-glutamine methyltransferase [Deferribacteraceae bacterium]|jgi:release factor glutamine methyltransferase|nr:peptide chain release factor N(5)-glutamine methyltransferase [Deferribacteraceae bacterium]